MGVLAHGCALGAMCPQVEGRIEAGFLADPDAVLYFRHDGATHRAVGADRFLHGGVGVRTIGGGLGLADHTACHTTGGKTADCQAGAF